MLIMLPNPLMGRQFIDASMLYDSTSDDAILSPNGASCRRTSARHLRP